MLGTTNSAQSFIRGFVFLVVFVALGAVLFPFILVVIPSQFVMVGLVPAFLFNVWVSGVAAKMFYVLPEWERLVLLRLGHFAGVKGPGLFIIPPFIYSVANIVDRRVITPQVEATATLTKDNVPTKVTAALEFEVEDAQKAVLNVQSYLATITWISTEALKNTIGSLDLKELLSNREQISSNLKVQIDQEAQNYGINVRAVRITDIDTPQQLIEELAVIARARRAAHAKQIQAQAEVEVARKLAEASEVLSQNPNALRLREIQNMSEISKEESSTIIIYPYGERSGEEIAHSSIPIAASAKHTNG
jgi:regulator of protease activity HflC (stomatin/prohibitin superfamily)